MTSKRRKYGDLSARPLPTDDTSLLDDVFAAFTGTRLSNSTEPETHEEEEDVATQHEVAGQPITTGSRPESSQPQRSRPQPSRLRKPPLAGYGSRLEHSQPQHSQPQNDPPQPGSQPHNSQLDMMAALPEVEGHTEMPHQIVDHLYPYLGPFEQAVFTQLYRLSWGYKTNRCRISNERLAERAGMSVAKLKQVTRLLESKGLVKKVERHHGQNVIQGVEYEVRTSSWELHRSQPQRSRPQSSRLQYGTNKEKDLKENVKGVVACPDCFGTGMWYPEGYRKGVARCSHERLKKK